MASPVVAVNFYDEDLNVKINTNPVLVADLPFVDLGFSAGSVHHVSATVINEAGLESPRSATLPFKTLPNPVVGQPMLPEKQAAIDAIVQLWLAVDGTDGSIIGITSPDGDYYKAYGGDGTPGLALTLDHKMRFGSCTKMYTALLVLAQVDAGHITLDDKLDQFVSGVPNGGIITIKMLLQMQSGIEDYLQGDPTVNSSYFLNPTSTFDPLPYIRSYAPIFEPGTQSSYSNSNYILLGMILEWCDATYGAGRDVRTIIIEDCLGPLGLNETEWPTGSYMTAPYSRAWSTNLALPTVVSSVAAAEASIPAILRAFLPSDPLALVSFLRQVGLASQFGIPAGLQLTPEIEWTAVSTTWAGAAGALGGPVADLVRFGEAIASGALLSPEMKQLREEDFVTYQTYSPAHPWEGPGWMGFGLGVIQWGSWLGWVGNIGGYIAVLFANPTNGAVIAVTMNNLQAINDAIETFYQIAYYLYPDTTLIQPTVVRMGGGVESPREFGSVTVVRFAAAGDVDGTTTVPHKVPITL